jgi:hypothetical protein
MYVCITYIHTYNYIYTYIHTCTHINTYIGGREVGWYHVTCRSKREAHELVQKKDQRWIEFASLRWRLRLHQNFRCVLCVYVYVYMYVYVCICVCVSVFAHRITLRDRCTRNRESLAGWVRWSSVHKSAVAAVESDGAVAQQRGGSSVFVIAESPLVERYWCEVRVTGNHCLLFCSDN